MLAVKTKKSPVSRLSKVLASYRKLEIGLVNYINDLVDFNTNEAKITVHGLRKCVLLGIMATVGFIPFLRLLLLFEDLLLQLLTN